MAVLYVAAEAAELKPFGRRLRDLRKLKWPLDYAAEGVLDGRKVILAANGAGPRLASQAVEVALRAFSTANLSSSKLDAVVSTGFCGGLHPSLSLFEIVLGTGVLDADSSERIECQPVKDAVESLQRGLVLSQDRIANGVTAKERLALLGAIAVEMEAFGAATRTNRAGLPFYCIKVVSDCAHECFGFDLNRMRTSDGHIARGKIVSYALTHPKLLPELMDLRKRSENAAEALGEFLVSCRIKPESNESPAE